MSEQMLSDCGIDCSACPAYLATQANDIEKLTTLAGQWFEGVTDYTIMMCDGCQGDGHLMKWCGECPIRACAAERELENCAYCADFGCEKLLRAFEASADARSNLERVRASL